MGVTWMNIVMEQKSLGSDLDLLTQTFNCFFAIASLPFIVEAKELPESKTLLVEDGFPAMETTATARAAIAHRKQQMQQQWPGPAGQAVQLGESDHPFTRNQKAEEEDEDDGCEENRSITDAGTKNGTPHSGQPRRAEKHFDPEETLVRSGSIFVQEQTAEPQVTSGEPQLPNSSDTELRPTRPSHTTINTKASSQILDLKLNPTAQECRGASERTAGADEKAEEGEESRRRHLAHDETAAGMTDTVPVPRGMQEPRDDSCEDLKADVRIPPVFNRESL